MSTEKEDFFEEILRNTIREQLESNNLSFAEAARIMGEKDSLSLRDVCNGRKRATADFGSRLGGRLGLDELLKTIRDGYATREIADSRMAECPSRLITQDETERKILVAYRANPDARDALKAVVNLAFLRPDNERKAA